MNEFYSVNRLFIGNTFVSCHLGGNRGPINTTSKETTIFYKEKNHNNRFIEVFTKEKFYQSENSDYIFNNKYIVNINNIVNYLSEEEITTGKVTNSRLVEIYNQINLVHKNVRQKQLQK